MVDRQDLPNRESLAFVEERYNDYLRDPSSVSEAWRAYFAHLTNGAGAPPRGPSFKPRSIFNPAGAAVGVEVPCPDDAAAFQLRVDKLVRNFRVRGHILAQINPLGTRSERVPEIEPEYYGLTEADMDRPCSVETIRTSEMLTLRQVLDRLHDTYCRSIGVQFMHIDNLQVREWLQSRMESTGNRLELSREEQIRILTRLSDAVIFEEFIQKKYLGAKSFSLEGTETLIPLLDLAIEKAAEQGIVEIMMGMAHRGRLNVLANILGKAPQDIFREFEDVDAQLYVGRGDVKYHKGYSGRWRAANGRDVLLSLCFNPSHLEFVNPVAVGRMRAKMDRTNDHAREKGMVLLVHGDAAFAGEGIVQETLNLSELAGYTVGGVLHIIVNNQIGFTTGPEQGRSSYYATDVAKMLQSPIFHVNGEDPEAVAQVVRLAMDFRREFRRDVVIDMYGYRRLGHNEGDEPSFTQPLLYDAIAKRKSVREGYLEHLLALGEVTREEADRIVAKSRERLESHLSVARSDDYLFRDEPFTGIWKGYVGGRDSDVPDADTAVPAERLSQVLKSLTRLPAGFTPHPKIARRLELQRQMAEGKKPLDWATAEALAFATLALEGTRIRMSGQDSERGTFSQRHAVLHDVKTGETYMPLAHLSKDQAPVEIHNSPLSEAGVLGFEYGYSLSYPEALVIWEAQFGDFVNAAQVMVDQFVASAENKWRRLSGLTLLLPHGQEGQGPEHSSARLERFLQLAAEDNIQVVQPSTPAQYFHLLRRQVLRPIRKPLVVMTPKSLLRHPKVASSLEDCASGTFRRVLPEPVTGGSAKPPRVLLCSGKVYYELAELRETHARDDVVIIRLEQFYPLPDEQLYEVLSAFEDGTSVFWVQEEPENQGAWRFLRAALGDRLCGRLPFGCVSRPASASPATGSGSSHKLEQSMVLVEALGDE
ncbi:MAG: 2-oxoglutarate dehydrogenase E1 component [Fimbriimonadia bacterium]|jgi:2-oxoglutarate dehydrogenase E1 component